MDDREAYEFYADPANRVLRGTPRKRQGPRLTNMASVRFDPAAIGKATVVAHEEGMTVSSWIRRLVERETEPPRMVAVTDPASGEDYQVPADALERVMAALMPGIIRHGCVTLQMGIPPDVRGERPRGLIEGSGRKGESKALRSSLSLLPGRTFACPHLSVGSVISASCVTCGPLAAVA